MYSYFIQTFGCQMNYSDSERMAAFLSDLGMQNADSIYNADLIVLNTCSVRQKAEDRINGFVNNIRSKVGEKPKIVITGCMARRVWDDKIKIKTASQKPQEERYKELLKIFPKVDIVIETKEFAKIGNLLSEIFNQPDWKTENRKDQPDHYLSFKPKYKNNFQAYVPISTGCNHFCTFCIVPYSRGKEFCRRAEEIIREVFELVLNGYKDITLLGQTVNRWINPDKINEFKYDEALTKIDTLNEIYMDDQDLKEWKNFFEFKINSKNNIEEKLNFETQSFKLKMPRDFLQLIQVLDQIPGNWWTTWISSHPNYMTKELIQYIGKSVDEMLNNKFSLHQRPYIHFALQSGSDRMLKKMNRRYSYDEFYKIVRLFRKAVKNISLSTDVIVGFVDETEEDFEKTLKAQKECKFDMIYISEYSPRPGTASARLTDNVDPKIKAKRKEELNELLKKIAFKNAKKLLGTNQIVLLESYDEKKNVLSGRTSTNKEVQIDMQSTKDDFSKNQYLGNFAFVKIISNTPWALKGEFICLYK